MSSSSHNWTTWTYSPLICVSRIWDRIQHTSVPSILPRPQNAPLLPSPLPIPPSPHHPHPSLSPARINCSNRCCCDHWHWQEGYVFASAAQRHASTKSIMALLWQSMCYTSMQGGQDWTMSTTDLNRIYLWVEISRILLLIKLITIKLITYWDILGGSDLGSGGHKNVGSTILETGTGVTWE